MKWNVVVERQARKELEKIDPSQREKILSELLLLQECENPRERGKALQGKEFEGLWRYRVGDYRIIAQITDRTLTITALTIAHRREVYR